MNFSFSFDWDFKNISGIENICFGENGLQSLFSDFYSQCVVFKQTPYFEVFKNAMYTILDILLNLSSYIYFKVGSVFCGLKIQTKNISFQKAVLLNIEKIEENIIKLKNIKDENNQKNIEEIINNLKKLKNKLKKQIND